MQLKGPGDDMDLMDAIYTRRSVRRYISKPVEKEQITKLMEAAVQAPSAMNSQPWAFAVMQDSAALNSLSDKSKSCLLGMLDRLPALQKYQTALESPDFNIFYGAGTLVVVCAKPNLSPNATTDCAMAAQNVMLTARDLGLGTCWIGFAVAYLNTPEGKRELNIPEEYSVVAPLIVGHPEVELDPMEKNPPEVLFWG